jgi:choline dehydrogenase-like flavoprotein
VSRQAYDYVIVGGGPAGCVLAYRLSANPTTRVLLLEAGSARAPLGLRLLARFTNWFDPQLRWMYDTVPQAAMHGRRIYLPQGRTLGGGSAINAMTYVRGQADDYDGWRRLGNDGWGYDQVLAAFKRLENNETIHDAFHARGGPLNVAEQVQPHPLTQVFVEAGQVAGLPYARDFNGASQEGVGTYQVTQKRGRRWSAADAFVNPIRGRPNLTIQAGAYASKVAIEGGRAVGVEVRSRGEVHQIRADREVIVSGGAINSPKLLLLSGIGPADELRRLGIRVVHDLPGVGRNLHDHLNAQVITRCNRPITYDRWDSPLRFARFGLQFLLFNTGVATSNICEGGAFLRSGPDALTPDVQMHFLPLIWIDYGRVHVDGYGMTLETAFLRPESRGTVTLASADAADPPLIDPAYCTEPGDLQALVEAVRRGREIMHARPFHPFLAGELRPGLDVRSDVELADYVRHTAITTYHPVGTCKMGRDDAAVVDCRLRVRGLEALRVVDSSIMPRIVSGSTQSPSMMIGEMGAAMILAPPTVPRTG